jgi:hypothetical protein
MDTLTGRMDTLTRHVDTLTGRVDTLDGSVQKLRLLEEENAQRIKLIGSAGPAR